MEDQLIQLLSNTQRPEQAPRQQAEIDLKRASTNPAFPQSLANVAAHTSVDTNIRQSALSTLRLFIESNWAVDRYAAEPQIPISDEARAPLRQTLLDLAISPEEDRKVKISASYAVGKIAVQDYPEQWPTLLPTILNVIPSGTDAQLHGALRVLGDLIEETLSEHQFFTMARDIARTLTEVALNDSRKPHLRALAISVFRGCFDMMNMIKEDHGKEVKAFAEELLNEWNPFFITVLKSRLPEVDLSASPSQPESWNSIIALKLQVVKTLLRIRRVFPALLLPQSTALFTAVWEELMIMQGPYEQLYIVNDAQGRLEDSDNLPYTLDFLILEELDFLNQCFRAAPVQAELDSQLKAHASAQDVPWMMEIMRMLVSYSRVTREEEELWDIDCSLYLAEETSVTANYTARVAASDLLIKMGEWFDQKALDGLFGYTKTLFGGSNVSWHNQESALFLFVMLASDFQDLEKPISDAFSTAYLELVDYAINRPEEPLLRARGYLVAGMVCRTFDAPPTLLDHIIGSITQEQAEVVQVASIKAVEGLINAGKVTADKQVPIIKAIEQYMSGRDPEEMEDADELLVTLSEALRAAIRLNSKVVLSNEVPSIDLLFLLAKIGASNFQVTMMVAEAVEEVVRSLEGPDSFAALCSKLVPTLMGAFDVSRVTDDSPLVTVATELLEVLVEHAAEPLPAGFVAATFPKLTKVLMESSEGDVLRPGAEAAKWILAHDHQQVFSWQDEAGRSGLEVCLHIIDRLLGPTIEDNSATEVGGLAAELVEKAGQERLGPFLPQLLHAVANRLATAQAAQLIQSLMMVFARLSLASAHDVVEFLSQIQINGEGGLQIVMSKWLENSVNFAGYDEIRQNVIALSKLYSLNDPRLGQISVKGDLIVANDGQIKTRSRAKQNPDQYTIIPAPLKIVKLLIDELLSASGARSMANATSGALGGSGGAGGDLDSDDDDEGWEDDDDTLDMGLASTKADLMSFIEGPGLRQPDDETQSFLTDFFLACGRDNTANFQDWYGMLTDEEKNKLNELANGQ
ncbi:importin-9 [Geosmithia morbida]|uniref:Importin-9 n=1 Tax=Geosmithia morbida TaxID=1094350 RepID=A0A9P4Z2Y8_9HYPO|nr:importin-9 [Geosmithia morbida]KAF4126487.1 importin-9 [Geosmithia morbida]